MSKKCPRLVNHFINWSTLTVLSWGGPCWADFFVHPWDTHHVQQKAFDLGVNLDLYSTTEDFDATGAAFFPAGLQKYSRLQVEVSGSYGLSPLLTLYGRGNWSRVQLTATQSAVGYGGGDQMVGLNYRLLQATPEAGKAIGNSFDLQLQADLPIYDDTAANANGTPFLGDGSTDISVGGFLTVPLKQDLRTNVLLTTGAGYTYRSAGFSAAVPWSVTASYNRSDEGLFGAIAGFGIFSMKNDQNLMVSGSQSSAGAGGSFMTNAVNPTLFNVRGVVGYQVNPDLALNISATQAVSGQSAPLGFMISAGLETRLSSGSATSASGNKNAHSSRPPQMPKGSRANDGLVTYSLEAKVVRTNDKLNLVKIDKGSQQGVEVGQLFDIFKLKQDGTPGEAVARGRVINAGPEDAAMNIIEYFREIWIDEGFIARRVLN